MSEELKENLTQEEQETNGLMNLIPEQAKIICGRSKDKVDYYYLYPLSIRDFKKLEGLIQKLIKLFMENFHGKTQKITNSLLNDLLPELLELMAISSYTPEEEPKLEEIKERAKLFEKSMTFPQVTKAIEVIITLNKFDDILKNLTNLIQKNSRLSGVVKPGQITGGQHLKR
jgi:hypothetical protein